MQLTRIDAAAVLAIYDRPFPELAFAAITAHRASFDPLAIQRSTLLSVKTGGCSEDCGYCAQSARRETHVRPEPLAHVDEVVEAARAAKAEGATRFCMGAAWRGVKDGPAFERVLAMVREVNALGMESCVTLGALQPHQAQALRDAGLQYYNHNLDTSREYYPQVVSTHAYDDRLQTLERARAAGLKLCCGGIIGMGESRNDRIALIAELAAMESPPESVPVNLLVPIEGTPLAERATFDPIELVRTVATLRIVLPSSHIRLAAGRSAMSAELQTLCFLLGANSIFSGDRLLTTENAALDSDAALFAALGMYAEPGSELH